MEKFLHLHEEARQWLNTLGYAQENTKDNRRLIVQCAFFAEEMLKKQQSEKSEEMLKGRQSEPTAHAWIPAHESPTDWKERPRKFLLLTLPPKELQFASMPSSIADAMGIDKAKDERDTLQGWYRGKWIFEFNPVHPMQPIVTHWMELPEHPKVTIFKSPGVSVIDGGGHPFQYLP